MTREDRARERVAAALADYASSPHPLRDILFRLVLAVERETAQKCAEMASANADECMDHGNRVGFAALDNLMLEIRGVFNLEQR